MKIAPHWIAIVAMFIVSLLGISLFLLRQNISYVNKNRKLLLQNDSIISANIRLSVEADKWKRATFGVPEKVNHAKVGEQ